MTHRVHKLLHHSTHNETEKPVLKGLAQFKGFVEGMIAISYFAHFVYLSIHTRRANIQRSQASFI